MRNSNISLNILFKLLSSTLSENIFTFLNNKKLHERENMQAISLKLCSLILTIHLNYFNFRFSLY